MRKEVFFHIVIFTLILFAGAQMHAQSPETTLLAVPTTKVLAIGTLSSPLTEDQRKGIMSHEVPDTVKLYLAGKIDQWYVRKDGKGVVFLLNLGSTEEAKSLLQELPLGQAKLMSFEMIPLGPLSPLELLLTEKRGDMFQAQTPNVAPPQMGQATVTIVSRDTTDDAGDPITYISTPNPEVTSAIVSLPSGGKTDWMTHPCPGYLYVLEGELTVEFENGHHLVFKAGQSFMQARTKWHRGVNNGTGPMRFLAVFFGAKGMTQVLNPPHGAAIGKP